MSKQYTAHIISHTHWDREWYLNSPYTNEWLIPFFDGLFAMIEKEPDYKFVLDGQLSMIEDYFEELSKNDMSVAKAKRTIKKYVKSNSLSIGPYYLQPDWQLISAESLVRNIMIGTSLADALGGSMESGWLLDNFGQISQTAQIHAQSGMTGLFVWRGVAMDPENVTSEFIWEAPDGTKMTSVYLLNSYRNVMRLAEYKSIMHDRMKTEVDKLKPFATTSNVLMMNGYDQEMVPDDIQPYIQNGELNGDDFTTIQTDPDSYIAAIKAESPELQTLKGPLYNGRFISVFPGVMSARIYLKQQNDRMQRLLEKKVEPLSALSWLSGLSYDQPQIALAWKTLLKNHPHDSICGVSIDDVHSDMENRGREVFAMGSAVLEYSASELAGIIDTSNIVGDEALIVFNTAPYSRSEVIYAAEKSYYVKEIPAMGYRVVTEEDTPESSLKVNGLQVENDLIGVTIATNGTFTVTDKATGKSYANLGLIEDTGDSGDEYNYSYPDVDRRYTSEATDAVVEIYSQSDYQIIYKVFYTMNLPVSDCEGHTQRSEELLNVPVTNYITITADSPVVTCKTSLRNTVKDHRMRVLFPTGITTESSWASSPFDITERPIHIADYNESEIPDYVSKVIVGAREAKPSTYFHNNGFIDMNDEKEGLAVFTKGLPEYQIIEDDTIAVTLFRSVGWIAKEINTRIGDAGPEIYTPDAQCLREMTFEYAVCPHTGDAHSGVVQKADSFNNELIAVSTKPSAGVLPGSHSWFNISDDRNSVRLTACKRSEDGKSLIIRGVNTSTEMTSAVLRTSLDIISAEMNNLREKYESDLTVDAHDIALEIPGKRIFTIRLNVNRPVATVCEREEIILEDAVIKEDFSQFPYTDYVTLQDIEDEGRRADSMRDKLDDPLYRRTALEAQLSEILTKNRKHEESIRALGYQLNEARVQRRIHDYIQK